MQYFVKITFLAILFVITSCNLRSNKEWYEQWKQKAQPEYDSKRQVIYNK